MAVFCVFMMTLAGSSEAVTHYVNPGQSIQAAIDDANDGDEIDVAPGTYYEAIDFNGKALRLYSSGGPGITTIDANGLNTSVVKCISGEDANTVLDGFTITGGTGTPDEYTQLCGGGMRNESSSPTVTNCIFTNNSAEFGGGLFNYAGSAMVSDCTFTNNTVSHWGAGLYNNNSSPTVTNCTFSGNEADQNGGGMHNREDSSPTIKNCKFVGNTAGYGAGMYNVNYSNPTVTDCNFIDNIADQSGGGMYNNDDSNSIVTNCTFSDNNATNVGGGMCNRQSNPTVTDCTFIVNSATNAGGGIYNYYNNMTLIRCTFTGNTTAVNGGGVYNNGGSSTITDCTFSSNSADYGGGMYNIYSASPTVTNCVFLNNTATGLSAGAEGGGGMLNQTSATPSLINCVFRGNSEYGICNLGFGGPSQATVINCILWADTPDEIYNEIDSIVTVTYSDVQGGWGGTGNIDADPRFVDANNPDPNLWNLRLKPDSPCIDTGDNNAPGLPATDLAGNLRIADGDQDGTAIVDMGAYELSHVRNVTRNLYYGTIQWAIDDANDGDQIEVAPGTYNEAINFIGKAIRLYSSGGPDVTAIDGGGAYHVVQCVSGEGPDTILEGFTITGGNANGIDSRNQGGGMYNRDSSSTVKNCTFTGNSAGYGGGMLNDSSSPTITDCNFIDNTATDFGGGMENYDGGSPSVTNCLFSGNTAEEGGGMINNSCSPTVTNCLFSGNTAEEGGGMYNLDNSNPTVAKCTFSNNTANYGGGMYNYDYSSPTLTKCTFSGNSAYDGGGMKNYFSSPSVTNCTFMGNSASYGGGMYSSASSPTVTNCTFTGNIASSDMIEAHGGGMYNSGSGTTVTNCILWNDTPEEIYNHYGGTTVTYSDVQGSYSGTGNIDVAPCFVDPYNPDPNLWNLRLKTDSPCIDAGDTTAVPGGTWADIGGNPRVLDDPQIPDTGVSLSGLIVDMGAYEFFCSGIHGDINCDGVVDFKDIAILCGNWLEGTD